MVVGCCGAASCSLLLVYDCSRVVSGVYIGASVWHLDALNLIGFASCLTGSTGRLSGVHSSPHRLRGCPESLIEPVWFAAQTPPPPGTLESRAKGLQPGRAWSSLSSFWQEQVIWCLVSEKWNQTIKNIMFSSKLCTSCVNSEWPVGTGQWLCDGFTWEFIRIQLFYKNFKIK